MEERNESYYVGVRFPGSDKAYYYSTKSNELKIGDIVIVDSDGSLEAASVCTCPKNMSNYSSQIELKPIIRKGTPADIKIQKQNESRAKMMMAIAQQEANRSKLPMDFVASYLSFNGDIITLVYTSTEKRVDFRDLLPVLGSKLKARVSLRQIASRDRAKMIGGLGICGLPLCCSTFLSTFESISISKMKNQMLAINIPKYSGPCEKLMCCLAYEDELYATEKPKYPRINQELKYDGETYTVASFNILSRTVRITNADHSDFQTFSLEDVLAMIAGNYKPKEKVLVTEKEYQLPDYNIAPSKDLRTGDNERQKNGRNDKNNREMQGKGQNNGKNNNQQNRSERQDRNNQRNQSSNPRQDDRRDQSRRQNKDNGRNGKSDNNNRNQGKGNQQQKPNQQQRQNNQQQQQNQNQANRQRQQNQQQQRRERPAGQNGDASNRIDNNGEKKPQRRHHYHHRRPNNGGGNNSGGEA